MTARDRAILQNGRTGDGVRGGDVDMGAVCGGFTKAHGNRRRPVDGVAARHRAHAAAKPDDDPIFGG